MRNHFSRHRKIKTWKINVKNVQQKKEKDKTEYFGNKKKTEKMSFAEVYKDTMTERGNACL